MYNNINNQPATRIINKREVTARPSGRLGCSPFTMATCLFKRIRMRRRRNYRPEELLSTKERKEQFAPFPFIRRPPPPILRASRTGVFCKNSSHSWSPKKGLLPHVNSYSERSIFLFLSDPIYILIPRDSARVFICMGTRLERFLIVSVAGERHCVRIPVVRTIYTAFYEWSKKKERKKRSSTSRRLSQRRSYKC